MDYAATSGEGSSIPGKSYGRDAFCAPRQGRRVLVGTSPIRIHAPLERISPLLPLTIPGLFIAAFIGTPALAAAK